MREPTPTKQQITEEKYNELYELLIGKLQKSMEEGHNEFFKKIALSGMPERPTFEANDEEWFYQGSDLAVLRNDAANYLAKYELSEKYAKLKKDLDDASKEVELDENLTEKQKDEAAEAQKLDISNAEKALFNFLFENYKGKEDFRKEENALNVAKDALKAAEKVLSEKIKHAESELDKSKGEEATSKAKAKIDALKAEKIDKKLFDAFNAAKAKFVEAVKEYIIKPDNLPNMPEEFRDTSKYIDKMKALREYTNWVKKAKKTNDVLYSEEAINLLERVKSAEEFQNKLVEINNGVFSKGYESSLEQLQDLEKEINSSALNDKTVKPSFSERVKSSFETAMNYLKKNQNKSRYIAGGLLATVFIYNIVAAFAGFNAFSLMASIATLTSTLPLVLAAVEIALITFAGTSLIAYTATSDKVRKACSIVDLKEEPLTNKPSGSNSRVEGAPTPR